MAKDWLRYGKELDEYSWHPEIGWWMLSRTRSYQRAVNEFLKAAKEAKDFRSLKLFEELKEAGRDFHPKSFKATILKSPKRKSQKFSFSYLSVKEPVYFPKSTYVFDISKAIDVKSKHYRRFCKWYGDVVTFPLSPLKNTYPSNVFDRFWSFRPVMEVNPHEWVGLEKNNLVQTKYKANSKSEGLSKNDCYIMFKINKNFSEARIGKEIAQAVSDRLRHELKKEDQLPRWNPYHFDEFDRLWDLQIWSEVQMQMTGKPFSLQKIGNELYKTRQHQVGSDVKMQVKSMVRRRIDYMNNVLIKYFERKAPKK